MILFVVGPRSPDGLDAQQQAEENLKVAMTDAPRALGALISININNVMRRRKEKKSKCLAEDFSDIDDRVSENYALLLSMTEEVSDRFQLAQKGIKTMHVSKIGPRCVRVGA